MCLFFIFTYKRNNNLFSEIYEHFSEIYEHFSEIYEHFLKIHMLSISHLNFICLTCGPLRLSCVFLANYTKMPNELWSMWTYIFYKNDEDGSMFIITATIMLHICHVID